MNKDIYYVYCHINPITDKIFYIGIGKGNRVFSGGEHRNKEWKKEVLKGQGFKFKFLYENISKKKALELERSLINEIGLANLTNVVGECGNSTAFKKGFTPWNKGLTGAQACVYKPLIYEGQRFESVVSLRVHLGMSHTTFYRRRRNGKLKFQYV